MGLSQTILLFPEVKIAKDSFSSWNRSTLKELLLKYCLQRVRRCLGAWIKDQKGKALFSFSWKPISSGWLSGRRVGRQPPSVNATLKWESFRTLGSISLTLPQGGQARVWGSVEVDSEPTSVTYRLWDYENTFWAILFVNLAFPWKTNFSIS